MYLLEGAPAPDHATIARFKYLHFSPVAEQYLAAMSEWLYLNGEISGHDIFIDGTKIESCANKYTFVWKKAVTKSQAKVLQKAVALVEQCEEINGIRVVHDGTVTLHKLKKLRRKLYSLKEEEGVSFVHGTGKRKSRLQKTVEELEHYIDKLKEYSQKLHVCGERNSYSKTDPDATFMRMKEDAMLNGQLAFIRPANYEISKTRKYRQDIGRMENMTYSEADDTYTCMEGRSLTYDCTKRQKTASGYIRESAVYRCKDCGNCPRKTDCIRGNNCRTPMEERSKVLVVSKQLLKKRQECLERITSEEGCMLRMNRSIQAEGSFSEIKDGMGFRRYLSRGKENVLTESVLIAMARNINKLHAKIQGNRSGTHLYPIKSA